MLDKFILQPADSAELTGDEIRVAVDQLVHEGISAEVKADFLCRLALKGETVGEISAFVQALRDKSIPVPLAPEWRKSHTILDVCGTGGDRLNTFNISTTVALVCAAAEVPVAKHGNRAITSQAGSADVLEALGIRVDLPPAEAARALQNHNFAFFFAPTYHPTFKHIAPARKVCASRGQRTIFNFLGPLLNPAHPTAHLVGVSQPQLCQPLARVLQSLGVQRAMIVSGEVPGESSLDGAKTPTRFLDEISTLGSNTVAEFPFREVTAARALDLSSLPLQRASLADLKGGDRNANAEIVTRILRGDDRGPKRDAVLVNCAAALLVAGCAPDLLSGWKLAGDVIDSGRAAAKLEALTRH